MASKRNYHGLSESGVFYRDRENWVRDVLGQVKWDASTRVIAAYLGMKVSPTSREAFPTQERIAGDLGLSVPTVKRAVALLLREQYLRVRLVKTRTSKRPINHYSLIHQPDKGIMDDP